MGYPNYQNYQNYPDYQNNNKKKIIIAISAVVLAIVLAFGAVFCIKASRDPVDTVIAFCDKFNEARYDRMLKYVEPSEAKIIKASMKVLPDKAVVSALSVIIPFVSDVANIKLYPEVVYVTKNKKTATVTAKFKQIDDENYYDIYLRKKNGIWYIQYFWKSDYKG